MATLPTASSPWRQSVPAWNIGLIVALIAWFAIYRQLQPFSRWAVAHLPIQPGTSLADAVSFFLFDTPKVLMLLTLVVFAMGVVRTWFSPERTRAILAGRREGFGNVAAAGLGMLADIVRSVAGELENRDGGQAEPVVSKPIAEVMTPTSPTSAIVVPENCAVMDINICIGRRQLW